MGHSTDPDDPGLPVAPLSNLLGRLSRKHLPGRTHSAGRPRRLPDRHRRRRLVLRHAAGQGQRARRDGRPTPPTRAVATATLKRNLAVGRRIDAFDQLSLATTRTIERLTTERYPVYLTGATNGELAAELERQLADYDTDTDVLTALAATATFHGGSDADDLVLRAARRLAEPPRLTTVYQEVLANARRYPALRLVTAVGVAAVAAHREELLFPLLVQTSSATLELNDDAPLIWSLHPWRVFHSDLARLMPQYQPSSQPIWPASRYLRASCRPALADFTDDREYAAAFDRYELLRGMLEVKYTTAKRAALGEFAALWGTRAFDAGEIDDQWPLVVAGAFDGDAEQARQSHAAVVQQIVETPFL